MGFGWIEESPGQESEPSGVHMPMPFDSNLGTTHGPLLQVVLVLGSVVSAVRLSTQELVDGLRRNAYCAADANGAHVSPSHQPVG